MRGTVYVRSGPTTRKARPIDEQVLAERRRARDLPFDARPVSTAALDDLNLEAFKNEYLPRAVSEEVLEENERSVAHQLRSLRLAHATPVGLHPTVTGVLLLSADPAYYVPGAWVDFLRIDGNDLDAPVTDHARFSAPLAELVERVEGKLRAHVRTSVSLDGPREERTKNYPMAALREVFRNALLHRSYEGTSAPTRVYWFDDRVEIISPGGPFGIVKVDDFGQPGVTDYRNRNLASVMAALGYAQQFGRGFAIARRALAENANPHLDLQPTLTSVRVVLRPPD